MGHQSDLEELIAAWRALSTADSQQEGWRTIPLSIGNSARFRAGRHYPDNAEALLVSFDKVLTESLKLLPQGGGFEVCALELLVIPNRSWIALRRRALASVDLFSAMAEDLVLTLMRSEDQEEAPLLQLFLYRIRAWQDFMGRSASNLLSAEAELGLFGELTILKLLIEGAGRPTEAIQAWLGPDGGLQDFRLGHGALEVKSTLSSSGFPARVWSLDQLDDSFCRPLVLAAVRLRTNSSGLTLGELVDSIRPLGIDYSTVLAEFESKLIRAGYLHTAVDQYRRRFEATQIRFLLVDAGFPRLTRQSVPLPVTHASYVVDLDTFTAHSFASIEAVVNELGAI